MLNRILQSRLHLLALAFLFWMASISLPIRAEEPSSDLVAFSALARPLKTEADLDPLFEQIGASRWLLLGEASHGTSEYYTWRAAITRRAIEEKGFRLVVVEGDWSTSFELNRYVKHMETPYSSATDIMRSFTRWPIWMWANEETAELIEWIREFNRTREPEDRVGFYGMDIYGTDVVIRDALESAKGISAELAQELSDLYACFDEYAGDFREYAQSLSRGGRDCARSVNQAYQLVREAFETASLDDRTALFYLKMKAGAVRNAERHYRLMRMSGPHSWNTRVDHFHRVVNSLLSWYGEDSRAVVWAHNTHIGDARATVMMDTGMRNIGQLARERNSADGVFSVGFGSHRGTLLAGSAWGADIKTMELPEAQPETVEDIMHRVGLAKALYIFSDAEDPEPFRRVRGHRAVGVVYDPQNDPRNYVPTILSARYDAFIFIDETRALTPISNGY